MDISNIPQLLISFKHLQKHFESLQLIHFFSSLNLGKKIALAHLSDDEDLMTSFEMGDIFEHLWMTDFLEQFYFFVGKPLWHWWPDADLLHADRFLSGDFPPLVDHTVGPFPRNFVLKVLITSQDLPVLIGTEIPVHRFSKNIILLKL